MKTFLYLYNIYAWIAYILYVPWKHIDIMFRNIYAWIEIGNYLFKLTDNFEPKTRNRNLINVLKPMETYYREVF